MNTMSISLTLGKASSPHGANLAHNNRDFVSSNVDTTRIDNNIVYANQDIYEAYDELFSEALEVYNAKQKKPCRRIEDYYEHIEKSEREELFYELVVQFGSAKSAPVGSENGELAKTMLDEYMKSFQQRNPNLHVFSAHLHADEASYHVHIDFIPFTEKTSKYGLDKRVSMKSALDEMGFTAKNFKQNRLVAWQDSEREVMTKILNRHGLEREVMNDKSAHLEVDEFKREQELDKLERLFLSRANVDEIVISDLYSTVVTLEIENEKLLAEKSSPWKSFYYSSPEKQNHVISELDRLGISYRESGNGFEAQECLVDDIRKIEKSYRAKDNPHRDTLRDLLDKVVMQSKTFDDVVERLQSAGCEVKRGNYFAVRPKYATNYIRTHQLGADYSEQALRNRLTHKARFEQDVDNKIQSAVPDSPTYMVQKTIRHYTVVFAAGVLPVRKKNRRKVFAWTNDEQLDKLADLNRRINSGLSLDNLRSEFARLEKSVVEKDDRIVALKTELALFHDLYRRGERCFKYHSVDEKDLAFLAEHRVTAENYERITSLFTTNENEIAKLEQTLAGLRCELRDTVDTLDTLEKVMGGVWVQSLVDEEKYRMQSEYIHNGIKSADGNNSKIENRVITGRKH